LLAAGDYASEIEGAVGEEIYSPIFKSGLVLFGSGIISAVLAAFIISKSNSWEELGNEFERGKQNQLIDSAAPGAINTGGRAEMAAQKLEASKQSSSDGSGGVLDEIKALDL